MLTINQLIWYLNCVFYTKYFFSQFSHVTFNFSAKIFDN